ncbi:Stp1/IreP family PP2C-type Ser/Thr phosphatase [Liquorilactobacillus oeni]|uniref:protein-serine/threonine phosphatase n=1 Tax=Liquorilactobacillus oeni DSM 19972 TaxID=1423777 RepID=A0A0R1M999_9LACO|nr:Stp1/IreP family PP2C-type Ser/Thr phosphatase [Liquorilactobacillus oeni]KRL04702.1 serine threonine specific protein phosphatase [Liquorilactobacillus oeni DSM 19972]
MIFAYKSDIGRIRKRNEDYVGVFKNKNGIEFAVVADGLGGHKGGDVASEMAVSHLGFRFEETSFATLKKGANWLVEEVERENELILKRAQQYEDLNGMGTTLVCALFFGTEFLLANLGDSRGYLLRENELIQVTEDHSLVNELLKSGQISSEEAKHHPQKNIVTRTLGISKSATLDEKIVKMKTSDMLLLCTDGLTNMLSDEEIEKTLQDDATLSNKCHSLIKKANEAGGNDNITLLLARAAKNDEVEPQ